MATGDKRIAAAPRPAGDYQQHAGRQLQPALAVDDCPWQLQRRDQARHAENQPGVTDDRPDGVAQRQPGITPQGSQHRHGRLGRRGAEADDRRADHDLRQTGPLGQHHRFVDQFIGRLTQRQQDHGDQYKQHRHVLRLEERGQHIVAKNGLQGMEHSGGRAGVGGRGGNRLYTTGCHPHATTTRDGRIVTSPRVLPRSPLW